MKPVAVMHLIKKITWLNSFICSAGFVCQCAVKDPVTNLPERLLTTDSLQKQKLFHQYQCGYFYCKPRRRLRLKLTKALSLLWKRNGCHWNPWSLFCGTDRKTGLPTASNGIPLSSCGWFISMLAAGQKITINKPFKVAKIALHFSRECSCKMKKIRMVTLTGITGFRLTATGKWPTFYSGRNVPPVMG